MAMENSVWIFLELYNIPWDGKGSATKYAFLSYPSPLSITTAFICPSSDHDIASEYPEGELQTQHVEPLRTKPWRGSIKKNET